MEQGASIRKVKWAGQMGRAHLALGGTRFVVTLLTLLGAGVRFAGLDTQPVWLDEAFSLWMATQPLDTMLAWLVAIDHHPPLYYVLLHGWLRVLPASGTTARLLSALMSSAAIPLFAVAAMRLLGRRAGLVATLLLAVAPFQVRYAQEARMYALVTLAMTGVMAASVTVMLRARPGWWAWGGLAVSQAAVMLTHNVAAVLVCLALNGAVAAAWWANRGGNTDAVWAGLARSGFPLAWMITQIAALTLWSPWAWPFVQQARVVDGDFWIDPPTLQTVWDALDALTIGALPLWWPIGWLWTGAACVIIGRGWWTSSRPAAWWLGLLWLLPPVIALLVGLRRPIFYDRTLIWIALPALMALAAGIVSMPRQWLRVSAVTLILGLNGLGLWAYYAEFAKEPWDVATAQVVSQAAPGDLVLFHASWTQLPFDYYAGDAGAALERQGVPVTLFERGVLEPPMTAADVPALRAWVQERETVWLVYSHWWYTDPEGLVPAILDAEMRLVEEAVWPGLVVRRYGRE